MARADGSLRSLLARLSRIDVLVIDDWAMAPLSEPERRDFWKICEDRYQVRSTILTSQLPVSRWHEQIGDPTLADGILDRVVHNAHRIEMRGDSMRAKIAQRQTRNPKVIISPGGSVTVLKASQSNPSINKRHTTIDGMDPRAIAQTCSLVLIAISAMRSPPAHNPGRMTARTHRRSRHTRTGSIRPPDSCGPLRITAPTLHGAGQ